MREIYYKGCFMLYGTKSTNCLHVPPMYFMEIVFFKNACFTKVASSSPFDIFPHSIRPGSSFHALYSLVGMAAAVLLLLLLLIKASSPKISFRFLHRLWCVFFFWPLDITNVVCPRLQTSDLCRTSFLNCQNSFFTVKMV
ncbi:hypothetical protein K505DRAFT_125766 [Melanomma pulvis-pyrius CBS 109.77]|uniref:Uncharacterized protein n=1 Tax=Melanomma pulvis-pyrius CBS 109.77 TaxID=1314802 RepID=A0A6A6WU57_9PLEO|nr:hypothetical protein K505DRAFT_125766 [Melanomma pulvis-pyrius CBS 109.77]